MRALYFTILLSVIIGCEPTSKLPERVFLSSADENPNYDEIQYDSLLQLDKNGLPKELVNYIPLDLVHGMGFRFVKYLHPFENVDFENIPSYKIKYYREIYADTFLVKFLSKSLFSNKEPVLSDHYLGQEMYRLIWTPSFHDEVIIRISLENKKCHLIAYQICFDTLKVNKIEKELNERDFREFQELIIKTNYWAHEPYSGDIGLDGSFWTIEAHTKEQYGLLTRWSPQLIKEDEYALRVLGQWMLQKAGLDHLYIY